MNTDPNGYYAASQSRTVEQLKDERRDLLEVLANLLEAGAVLAESPHGLMRPDIHEWCKHAVKARAIIDAALPSREPDMTKEAPMKSATREQRDGWVIVDDGGIRETTGFFCDNPADPERKRPYWRCPDYGYSVPESELFTNQFEAAQEALRRAHIRRAQADRLVETLDLMVRHLAAAPSPRTDQPESEA